MLVPDCSVPQHSNSAKVLVEVDMEHVLLLRRKVKIVYPWHGWGAKSGQIWPRIRVRLAASVAALAVLAVLAVRST
jgi:hypothetical protein